jgi:NAD(P)-dependent dehydrogenase (short-subunit alcohol dehydrogenase family)
MEEIMDLGLKDRRVVVTGAGSGIGLAVTEILVAEGARVVAADLETSALITLGEPVIAVTADLGSPNGPQEVVDRAVDELGGLDILVNNVGIFPYRESFLSTTDEDWSAVLNLNFMSMVRACRAAVPHLKASGHGSIVSIASECGRQPDVFFVDYSVSKAAMLNLSKSLANEFGPAVRSNIVSPGPTRTPAWDKPGGFAHSLAKDYGMTPDEAVHHFATDVRKLPSGRLGKPEEVATVVALLASDLSAQVTGAEYTVNGGSYVFA